MTTIITYALAVTILPAIIGASLGFGIALGVQAAHRLTGRI